MVPLAFRPPKPSTRSTGRPSLLGSSSPNASASTTRSPSPASELTSSILAAAGAFSNGKDAPPDLAELNHGLEVLATLFPDIRHEVFREMLTMFSEESRVHMVAEQLIKHKAKWVNGRWRVPTREANGLPNEVRQIEDDAGEETTDETLPLEETFRTESYKSAVRSALCLEFKSLSKSTVDGVLAEWNHSYTLARPILLGLAAKTWRNAWNAFLSRWKKPTTKIEEKHFMLVRHKSTDGASMPSLRETNDDELDRELRRTLLQPLLDSALQAQEAIDTELAVLLHEQEAERANALFECECCFSDTTFEQMATCTTGNHTICFACIRHAVSEALYGQSWGLSIDHERGQVACLAPSDTNCEGCVPHHLTKRAVTTQQAGGPLMWAKLESRLADEALLKSQAPLIRCPFCTYAEIDALYLPPETTGWQINTSRPWLLLLLSLLAPALCLLLAVFFVVSLASAIPPPQHLVTTSLATLLRRRHLSPRFQCQAPSCRRRSCLHCRQAWRDPHTCHESAARSLRTTVEAARTAALKRTCPRCGLGFVKDSGCNKMVCPCGYAMCYVCRAGLGRRVGALPDSDGEGYRHFCQHFRAAGGPCAQCERCDLYRAEDGDAQVRRAGERAEREWRLREGVSDEHVVLEMAMGTKRRKWKAWSLQEVVDWLVEAVVKV